MSAPINPALAVTTEPPVMQALGWLEGVTFPPERPLIRLSQAAPVAPPPLPLREAMAEAVMRDAGAHIYGPVLGLPELRSEIAAQWSTAYGGEIAQSNVAVTAGCNQAFCAALASVAAAGDAVLIPAPWYFNHRMWADMSGIETRAINCRPGMLPDPDHAASLIDARTKAIVLVTPNNPTGAEYPSELVRAFYDLAQKNNLALILDETYRDFDSRSGAPHDLFGDPDWQDTLIQVYSFSKAYRLTGHRVGAMVCGEARIRQAEKFLDTVSICPNQLGQRGALFGMRHLGQWLAGERAEILDRRAAVAEGFHGLQGWSLLGAGAYFAYVEHGLDQPSPVIARRLVHEAGLLVLPGEMFMPAPLPGQANPADRQIRIAFANTDRAGIAEMFRRLAAFSS